VCQYARVSFFASHTTLTHSQSKSENGVSLEDFLIYAPFFVDLHERIVASSPLSLAAAPVVVSPRVYGSEALPAPPPALSARRSSGGGRVSTAGLQVPLGVTSNNVASLLPSGLAAATPPVQEPRGSLQLPCGSTASSSRSSFVVSGHVAVAAERLSATLLSNRSSTAEPTGAGLPGLGAHSPSLGVVDARMSAVSAALTLPPEPTAATLSPAVAKAITPSRRAQQNADQLSVQLADGPDATPNSVHVTFATEVLGADPSAS
jgi:hypothetical protein